jgi:protein arginine N-methyltransferase 1
VGEEDEEDVNAKYFESYGDIGIHELMLKDEPRTLAYLRGIQSNPKEFKGKVQKKKKTSFCFFSPLC